MLLTNNGAVEFSRALGQKLWLPDIAGRTRESDRENEIIQALVFSKSLSFDEAAGIRTSSATKNDDL